MLGVIHVLGLMLAAFGAMYALPCSTALIAQDGTATGFICVSGLISSGIGCCACRGNARPRARAQASRWFSPRDRRLAAHVCVGSSPFSSAAATPVVHTRLLRDDVGIDDDRRDHAAGASIPCRRPSMSGARACTGAVGSGSSCSPWQCCRFWVLAACKSTGRDSRSGQGREAHTADHRDREVSLVRLRSDHGRRDRCAARVRNVVVRCHLSLLLGRGTRWILDARCEHRVFQLSGDRADAQRTHDRRLAELRTPLRGAAQTVSQTLHSGSRGKGHFAGAFGERHRHCAIAVVSAGVSELRDGTAARGFQRHLDRDDLGPGLPGLHAVAGIRPVLDAVPVLHHLQHRLRRRRHQDVSHAAARTAGRT